MSGITLRPYQTAAIQALRIALAGGNKRLMCYSPTGSGKTEIGMAMIRGAMDKGKRVVFLCNRIGLVSQASKRFALAGIQHGVIQGDNTRNTHCAVIIGSIQTVARRGMPDCDLIVIDEAHAVAGSKDFRSVIMDRNLVPVIGLSATPFSKGLGKHYDQLRGALFQAMVVASTIPELIDAGFLVDCDIYAPSEPDMTGIKTTRNAFGELDFSDADVGRAVDKPTLIGDIVAHWLKLANGTPTVCFAANIAHSQHIVESFRAAGVAAEHIDCYTDEDERTAILARVASGETMIISNVGILTEGWDFPACKTMILARPTRSLIRYIQMAGRVLRPHESKTCLERGTLVLTDCGEVEIQNITLEHKLWDGHNFVSHDGAICNGVRPVMTYDGITATCDHEVMTNEGWKTLADANRRGLRITRSGIGGRPVRIVEDRVERGSGGELQSAGSSGVRPVRRAAHGPIPQHEKTAEHGRLPALQWQGADYGSALAVPAVSRPAVAVSERVRCAVSFVRRAWNRISIRWAELCSKVGCRYPWGRRPIDATGSDRQQRPLRAWESEVGVSGSEREQQSSRQRTEDEVSGISTEPSGSQVCGQNSCQDDSNRNVGCGNCGEMGDAFGQAKREVWDVLNVGPLQRFTANGRLVHNCALILDHSGTVSRLGFPTDDFPLELDDGKPKSATGADQQKPEPKPCSACAYVKPPRTPVCPKCGHVARVKSEIVAEDGELELVSKKRKAKVEDKQRIWSELLAVKLAKGYSDGWAAHKYRAYFGVWPRGLQDVCAEPSPEIYSFITSQNIRFAKRNEGGHRAA